MFLFFEFVTALGVEGERRGGGGGGSSDLLSQTFFLFFFCLQFLMSVLFSSYICYGALFSVHRFAAALCAVICGLASHI